MINRASMALITLVFPSIIASRIDIIRPKGLPLKNIILTKKMRKGISIRIWNVSSNCNVY